MKKGPYFERFIQNVRLGELGEIKRKAAKHPEILQHRDEKGWSALHYASYRDRKILEWLIEHGATLEPNNDGWTALHTAVFEENLQNFSCLIGPKAFDVNVPGNEGRTPLIHAFEQGKAKSAITLLREFGASGLIANDNGFYPIHFAAATGNFVATQYMLNHNQHAVTKKQVTALHTAAHHGHYHLFGLFLDPANTKYDVNAVAYSKTTPLYEALDQGKDDAAGILIDTYNANVNISAKKGRSPLHIALEKKPLNLKLIKKLINKGAHLSFPMFRDESPLDLIFKSQNEELIQFVVDKKTIQYRTSTEQSFLHLIGMHGNLDWYEKLKSSYDINEKDEGGITPLAYAALNAHYELFMRMVNDKADITCIDNKGFNLHFYAAQGQCLQIIQYLVSRLEVKPSNDQFPHQLIKFAYKSAEEVANNLRCFRLICTKEPIRITHCDIFDTKHPIGSLIRTHQSDETIKKAIKDNLKEVNTTDSQGLTPLQIAAFYARDKVIFELLEQNVDINVKYQGYSLNEICSFSNFKNSANCIRLIDERNLLLTAGGASQNIPKPLGPLVINENLPCHGYGEIWAAPLLTYFESLKISNKLVRRETKENLPAGPNSAAVAVSASSCAAALPDPAAAAPKRKPKIRSFKYFFVD